MITSQQFFYFYDKNYHPVLSSDESEKNAWKRAMIEQHFRETNETDKIKPFSEYLKTHGNLAKRLEKEGKGPLEMFVVQYDDIIEIAQNIDNYELSEDDLELIDTEDNPCMAIDCMGLSVEVGYWKPRECDEKDWWECVDWDYGSAQLTTFIDYGTWNIPFLSAEHTKHPIGSLVMRGFVQIMADYNVPWSTHSGEMGYKGFWNKVRRMETYSGNHERPVMFKGGGAAEGFKSMPKIIKLKQTTSKKKMCERQTTNKYTSRNSPPYKANECCGKTKKGNDGQKYISKADKNGVCKWITAKPKGKENKTYYTHDNGGRPFKVVIVSPTIVEIYKAEYDDDEDNPTYKKLVKKYTGVNKIFIGKSPKNEMTKFSGGHGKGFDGNSVLLELNPKKYAFIGDTFYEFSSPEPIVKYISSVGNNDVPYPVALTKKFVFFMLDAPRRYDAKDKSFKLDMFRRSAFSSGTDWSDLYNEYYEMENNKEFEAAKKRVIVKVIHARIW
jgi:hypothetical protein